MPNFQSNPKSKCASLADIPIYRDDCEAINFLTLDFDLDLTLETVILILNFKLLSIYLKFKDVYQLSMDRIILPVV